MFQRKACEFTESTFEVIELASFHYFWRNHFERCPLSRTHHRSSGSNLDYTNKKHREGCSGDGRMHRQGWSGPYVRQWPLGPASTGYVPPLRRFSGISATHGYAVDVDECHRLGRRERLAVVGTPRRLCR